MKLLKKGKINWLVKDDALIAFDKIQATIYAPFCSPIDNLFFLMKYKVLNSKPDEYNNWPDVIGLAIECKVFGQGTRIPTIDKNVETG